MTATWVAEVLLLPSIVNRMITVFVYAPFAAACGWKLYTDIVSFKKQKLDILSWMYYGFVLYYGIVTIVRLLTGAEIKENLYYSIVFLGAMAIYLQIKANRIRVSKDEFDRNLLLIVLYLVAYRIGYYFVGSIWFQKQPINSNLLSGSIGFLLPYIVTILCDKNSGKRMKIISGIAVTFSLVIITATGARAIFLLACMTLAVSLLCNIINVKGMLRLVGAVLVAACIISTLAFMNFGAVRYALYRETGFSVSTLFPSNKEEKPKPEKNTEENEVQNSALVQIDRSDNMRGVLVAQGVEEIRKNPLFGTGNVFFTYELNKDYTFQQTSHNFVIETMNCYGAVGLVFIAALFLVMLFGTGIFKKSSHCQWRLKVAMLLTIVYYFALGFVQPIVYSPMLCLLFVILMAAFSSEFLVCKDKNNKEELVNPA